MENKAQSNNAEPVEPNAADAPESVEPEAVTQDSIRILEADNLIKSHVIAAMGVALAPVPLIDMVAIAGIQLRMLGKLSGLYQAPFSEQLGKKVIFSLLGGVLPISAAITIASLVKAAPGAGTLAGVAGATILGGAATYAVGHVFVQHFEAGGTLLDFDVSKMREYFADKFREGKQVATKLKTTS